MQTRKVAQFVESATAQWVPSKIPGVEYLALNTDPERRAGTFLLRMAPGTKYPRHRHPGGEEVLVLRGEMTVGGRPMKAGDFLYSPPGSVHEASTEKGCVFMSSLPEPIDIVRTGAPIEFDGSEAG